MEHKIRATFNAGKDTKNPDQDSELLLYFADVNKEKMDKIAAENKEIKAKNSKIWNIATIGIAIFIICLFVMAIVCAVNFILSNGILMSAITFSLTGILAVTILIMTVKCYEIADYFYTKFSKVEYYLQSYNKMMYAVEECSKEDTVNYMVRNNNFFEPIFCGGIDHTIYININGDNIKIDNELKDNVILVDGNMREDKNYIVSMYMNDHTKCLLEKLPRKK